MGIISTIKFKCVIAGIRLGGRWDTVKHKCAMARIDLRMALRIAGIRLSGKVSTAKHKCIMARLHCVDKVRILRHACVMAYLRTCTAYWTLRAYGIKSTITGEYKKELPQ